MNTFSKLVLLSTIGMSTLAQAQSKEERFASLDTDGNGTISFPEFQENGPDMSARADTNADGYLSLEEFMSTMPRRGPRRQAPTEQENADSTVSEQQQPRRERFVENATARFQEMDLDGDDLVSVAEFQEASFLRLDKDNNGALTAEELRPPHERGRRGGRRGNQTPEA